MREADEAAAALPRGTSFARYLILERVGEGGVGEVYAAYDPHLDRRIALKILRGHAPVTETSASGTDDRRWRTLVREAQILAKLSDPHVVTVHDVAAWEGRTFLAMELVDGIDFATWLERHRGAHWRDVLGMLLAAGRGLQAAHAAGVVHRDFKPANVLVGRGVDGELSAARVKVGDFGLARPGESLTPTRVLPFGGASVRQTTTEGDDALGPIAGTPRYMAPELFVGAAADVRSDLYAYCSSLFEALWGEPPFDATTMVELVDQKQHGPREPATLRGVPRALLRATMRGLAPRPEDRWPNMAALLAALERAARPRRATPIVAALALVGAAAATWAAIAPARACRDGERHLEGTWDAAARSRVDASIRATGVPYAQHTTADVAATLDGWAGRWVEAHTEVCERSRDGEQSEAALDLRMACLQIQRAEVTELVAILASADAESLEGAALAVHGVSAPQSCTQLLANDGHVEGPEATPLREELARAGAALRAGQVGDALDRASAVEADAVGLPRVAAEAALLVGRAQESLGRPESAEATLERTLFAAQALGHPRVQARAAIELAYVLAHHTARFTEGLRWAEYAEAELVREPAPDLQPLLHDARGVLLHQQGEYDDALAELESAVASMREQGADELEQCRPLQHTGAVLRSAGRYREALELADRVLEIRERVLGPDHPDVARAHIGRAAALTELGRDEEAMDHQRRALAILERVFGPDHFDVAQVLTDMAATEYMIGRFSDAVAHAERGLAIRTAVYGADDRRSASNHTILGAVLQDLGRTGEGTEHLRRALALNERHLGPAHDLTTNARANLANALAMAGDNEGAAEILRAAIAALEQSLGPDHPDVANMVGNLGTALMSLGRLDEAQSAYERTLAIEERALGSMHRDLLLPLLGLAGAHTRSGRPNEGIPYIERALAIADRGGVDPIMGANTRFAAAQTFVAAGRDRPRAIALVREAAATYAELGEPGMRPKAESERWLAALERDEKRGAPVRSPVLDAG